MVLDIGLESAGQVVEHPNRRPLASSSSTMCEPMNDAPPVTNACFDDH